MTDPCPNLMNRLDDTIGIYCTRHLDDGSYSVWVNSIDMTQHPLWVQVMSIKTSDLLDLLGVTCDELNEITHTHNDRFDPVAAARYMEDQEARANDHA